MEAMHSERGARGQWRVALVSVEQPDGKGEKKGREEEGAEDDTRADGSCTVLLNTEDDDRKLEQKRLAKICAPDQRW